MRLRLLIILCILIISCRNQTEKEVKSTPDTPRLELVQINLYGCFIYPCVFNYNVSDGSVLFQHSGLSRCLIEPPNHEEVSNEIIEVFKPKSLYFHLDSTERSLIADSIIANFEAADFKDSISDCCDDGGGMNLIFTYSNDSIIEAEIFNAFTENQISLISAFIDLSLNNAEDSLTKAYLMELN